MNRGCGRSPGQVAGTLSDPGTLTRHQVTRKTPRTRNVKTIVILTIAGAGIGGVGGFLYLGVVIAIIGEPVWGWGLYLLYFGLLYAMGTALFGAIAGLVAGAAYLVALSKAWTPRRAAIAAVLPCVVFAAAVMIVVSLGFTLPGVSGDLAETATFLAGPALLFAALTFALIRWLHIDEWI